MCICVCVYVIYVHTLYVHMYVCIHISSQRKSYHKFNNLKSFQTFDVECSASERVSNVSEMTAPVNVTPGLS